MINRFAVTKKSIHLNGFLTAICHFQSFSFYRFTIYLQTGPELEPDEVAFVLDFRFNYGADQSKIVTNHKKEGSWGEEEGREISFPLSEDEDFKIKIIVDDDSFKVRLWL